MNFLTLVFSFLLLLSFGTHLILEKQNSQRKLRSTLMGHLAAQRKILAKHEQHAYQAVSLPITSVEKTPSINNVKKKTYEIPNLNPECAKINLFSLIFAGQEQEPIVFEIMGKLLKTLYHPLFKEKEEAPFLTAFLQTSKQALEKKEFFALEKISLTHPEWQKIYYQMLKGGKLFPSLLDVVKVEESKDKICLAHAHPLQLELLFGPKVGGRLFQEIHQDPPTPVTKELIERVYSECHLLSPSTALLDLIEYGPRSHKNKTTYIAEDPSTHITLRKTLHMSKKV